MADYELDRGTDIVTRAPDIADDINQRRFRLLLLFGTMTSLVSFLDRSALNILAEPIKRDLGFSDTQLGLLTGFAFALFYSAVGLPIARYVDRPTTHRPTVVAACIAWWSLATALSGAVASYAQLFLARVVVAIGESGSGPAIITTINHYASPATRSRAFAIYGLGVPAGTLCGLALAGWLVDLVGWRLTFLIIGLPGLLLALLYRLLIHEPRTAMMQPATALPRPGIVENFATILRTPALRWLSVAAATGGIFVLGMPAWSGVFLIRIHGLSPTHAGLMLGVIMGVGGCLGTFTGGLLADRLALRDPGRALLVPTFGLLIALPAAAAAFASPSWIVFALLYFIAIFCTSAYFGPWINMIQLLTAENQRASATVIQVMIANLVGAGLGPFLIGMGSDLLRPELGADSLRWMMVGMQLLAIIPVYAYWRAGRLASAALAPSGA